LLAVILDGVEGKGFPKSGDASDPLDRIILRNPVRAGQIFWIRAAVSLPFPFPAALAMIGKL